MFRALLAATAAAALAGCNCNGGTTCEKDNDCYPNKCVNGTCDTSATGGGAGGFGGNSGGGAGGNGGGVGGAGGGGNFNCLNGQLTCASQGFNCGPAGDGCGQQLDCGTCDAGETCGAGGNPGVCGFGGVLLPDGGVGCSPKSCTDLGFNCGPAGDGCGLQLNCGGCDAGASESCGGGGQSGVCGKPTCAPKTCASLDAGCGQQGDGCGGLTPSCGTCNTGAGEICGGAGVSNQCGSADGGDGGRPCVNLCLQQNACDGGTRTSLSGTVYAPTPPAYGAPDPLSGAFVYVPNGTVEKFDAGIACEKCSSTVTGQPLVYTTSGTDGGFVLTDVPCGTNIPLVIQLGRWRRQITIPNVACCTNTVLNGDQTRLPRTQAEGNPNDNIPLIAITTGSADNLECVLPKIGIAQSEFTLPSGNGRVRMYQDNGVNPGGAPFNGNLPAATTLYNSQTELNKYDAVIVDCVGSQQNKTAAQRGLMETYANSGGRLLTSHFGYVWLYNSPNNISFTSTATWAISADPPDQDGYIDNSFGKGQTFAQWVYAVNAQAASSTPAVPRIRVNTVRHDMSAVLPPGERYVYGTANGNAVSGGNPAIPLEYAFNTPTAFQPVDRCGRVMFSDFHVSSGGAFPTCTAGAMTPQEKVFEYLIFDLTSCNTPYISNCSARTCQSQGFNCGPQSDGCGNVIQCGTCVLPQTCGGGGLPGVCGGGCSATTCAAQGFNCGPAGNGCGQLLDCGMCTPPQTCGGGGPGKCGNNACAPRSCADQGFNCGPAGNGCGGLLDCGQCAAGEKCGALAPGKCGPDIN